jgi:hypothetical protein
LPLETLPQRLFLIDGELLKARPKGEEIPLSLGEYHREFVV